MFPTLFVILALAFSPGILGIDSISLQLRFRSKDGCRD